MPVDGHFDSVQKLKDSGKNVAVSGPVGDAFAGLAVTLQVVVAQNDVVARGKASSNGDTWSGTAGVEDVTKAFADGPAIAYAAAVASSDKGIVSYQWHTLVTLET